MADLWPEVPEYAAVHGVCDLQIFQGKNGKPVIRLEAGGECIFLTANVAEMVGGAATGARKRWEDHNVPLS